MSITKEIIALHNAEQGKLRADFGLNKVFLLKVLAVLKYMLNRHV
jgi:hypothetical protein